MNTVMAKKKPKKPARPAGEPEPAEQPKPAEPKRYPSREKVRYVGLPLDLYQALERYAESKSDEDDEKSISWAARVFIRRGLTEEGFWPPPAP